MNRLLPVVLLLLIVSAGSGFTAFYEHTLNQQKDRDIQKLKAQLDDSSKKLAEAENQETLLSGELNQTRNQVSQQQVEIVKLQSQVANLTDQVANETAQIEKLRQQLKVKSYTTIGLSFMWNPELTPDNDVSYLRKLVDWLDQNQWDSLHIYFFVYAAQPEPFIPETTYCLSSTPWTWRDPALALYPVSDIPVAVVKAISPYSLNIVIGGCACTTGTPCSSGVIAFVPEYLAPQYIGHDANDLTWELLHVVGGVADDALFALPNSRWEVVIPVGWYEQIENIARQFEVRIPPDYFS